MRSETGFHFTTINIYILVAYWFTTWAMLVAMALLYDLATLLLPIAILRMKKILELVYEARPVNLDNLDPKGGVAQSGVWRDRRVVENSNPLSDANMNVNSVLGADSII